MLIILAAFLAGFVHVLSGPDHLAAIAPYAVHDRRRALRTGVRWGMGHAAGALGVGLSVLLLRDVIPVQAVSAWGERMVGVVLMAVGIWGLRTASVRARRRRIQPHHGRKAFAIGSLHGLAGSAHLLGVLPALALPSAIAAGAYLLLFGTGSIVAMGVFATLVGWIAGRPGASKQRAQSTLLGVSSLLALAVGVYWLYGAA